MTVLDVSCGMVASAIPAAERVGPTGHVIAVDFAEKLLNKRSQRGAEQGLTNIEFRRADLESLPFPDRTSGGNSSISWASTHLTAKPIPPDWAPPGVAVHSPVFHSQSPLLY
jgi:SAM-dependent methyltransferase